MKLGKDTASVQNYLMGNSSRPNLPEVGKGATVLHWTDRTAYFVTWVSKNGKEAKIQRPSVIRTDSNGMSEDQSYRFEKDPNAEELHIKFRYGKWREPRIVENGKMKWNIPINIVFGMMREYYDFSF